MIAGEAQEVPVRAGPKPGRTRPLALERRRLLAGFGAIALAVLGQRRLLSESPDIPGSVLLFLAGAVLLVMAFPARRIDVWDNSAAISSIAGNMRALWLGGISLVLLVVSLRIFESPISPDLAWALYVAAMIFAAACGYFIQGGLRPESIPAVTRAELAVVAALTVVGLFFRFNELETLPYGVWFDEAVFGLAVRKILTDPSYRPIFFTEFPNPAMFFYPFVATTKIFGEGPFALRAATAIAGAASIPAVFLLVRRLFGSPKVAIVAALLLAASSWHVTLSRFPTSPAIFTATLDIVTFYFLVKGFQDKRPAAFVFAGLAYGLDNNFYSPSRLVAGAIAALFAYQLLFRPASRATVLRGALLFGFGLLMSIGPLAQFAIRHPDDFNRRVSQVSVLPEIQAAGNLSPLFSNIEKHLEMFNVHGDNNGRHNYPGAPMLDPLVAGLFAIGIGYSLWNLRRPTYFLLLIWLAATLIPGILSLAFEAPQSLRAMGTINPALILAALPIGAVWDKWSKSAFGDFSTLQGGVPYRALAPEQPSRWTGPGVWDRRIRLILPITIVLLTMFELGWNYRQYFVVWQNDFASWSAHSTAETIVARRLAGISRDSDIYVSQYFADRPPSVQFLTPNAPPTILFDRSLHLPIPDTGRNAVLLLDPKEEASIALIRRYYPNAPFEEVGAPFGGPPVVDIMTLDRPALEEIEGVETRFFPVGGDNPPPLAAKRDSTIDIAASGAGVALPAKLESSTTLQVPDFGEYSFTLSGAEDSELFVNGTRMLTGTGTIRTTLARGNHALQVNSRLESATDRIQLSWRTPNGYSGIIPPNRFYLPPVTANGLLGRYFRSVDWTGPVASMQIDPMIGSYIHILPYPRPYSVEWTGRLQVRAPGLYRLGTEAISLSRLYIDGRLMVDNPQANRYLESAVQLSAGLHDIRLLFLDNDGFSHIYLYWTPPNGQRELIPTTALLPPTGQDIPIPEVGSASTASPAVRGLSGQLKFGPELPSNAPIVQVAAGRDGGFAQPRDLAIDQDGTMYIVDGQNRRIAILGPNGALIKTVGGPGTAEGQYDEPVAIVQASTGDLFVLDSSTGWISRLDRSGTYKGRFGGPSLNAYHPRGLAIDKTDSLYVADTGNNRIVKLTLDGAPVGIIGNGNGSGPGQLLEPTDITVLSTGELIVLDTGNKRLQAFDAFNRYRAEWPVPWSVPANGPHIAIDKAGKILVSDPDGRRIMRYDYQEGQVQVIGGPGRFNQPIGIAASPTGDVFVADTGGQIVARLDIPN